MAIFEVEGPDGRMYEVEANSVSEAFETADAIANQSNRPVTPEPGNDGMGFLERMFKGPGLDDQQIQELFDQGAEVRQHYQEQDKSVLDRASSFMQGLTDTATAGIAPAAERYGGGLVDYLWNQTAGDGSLSYPEAVDKITEERRARANKHPGFATAGGLAGGLTFGLGTSAVGQGLGMAGRVAASTALGGGEALATAFGRGDLTADNAAGVGGLGALAGGGGQLLGEALAPVARFARSRFTDEGANELAKRRLASSILDDATGTGSVAAAINQGKGLAPEQLSTMAQSTGGPTGQHLGEFNDLTRELYGDVARHNDVVGLTGPTVEMANRRLSELPEQAATILDDALINTNRAATGEAFKAQNEAARAAASKTMKEIFDSAEGRGVEAISKAGLRNRAVTLTDDAGNLIFDKRNMTPATKRTLDRFKELTAGTGDAKQKGLSMRALQQMKFELDDAISSAWTKDPTSADAVNTSQLKALRGMLNDVMGEADPRYLEASAQYADTKAIERAAKRGRELIKGTNTTAPLSMVKDYVDTLSGPELESMQDAALDYLQGQLRTSDTTLRKMAADNPDLMGRISTIFGGEVDVDMLSEALEEVSSKKGAYQKLAGAEVAGVKSALPQGSEHTPEGVFDAITTFLGLMPGRGAPVSAARRTIARATRGDPTAFNRNLLDLLQQNTPDKAQAAIDELLRLYNAPNASLLGGQIGGALVPGGMSTYGE